MDNDLTKNVDDKKFEKQIKESKDNLANVIQTLNNNIKELNELLELQKTSKDYLLKAQPRGELIGINYNLIKKKAQKCYTDLVEIDYKKLEEEKRIKEKLNKKPKGSSKQKTEKLHKNINKENPKNLGYNKIPVEQENTKKDLKKIKQKKLEEQQKEKLKRNRMYHKRRKVQKPMVDVKKWRNEQQKNIKNIENEFETKREQILNKIQQKYLNLKSKNKDNTPKAWH